METAAQVTAEDLTGESREEASQIGISYSQQSRAPLVSLVFVMPLLLVYEAGIVWQYFLLPALTIGWLLCWHHLTEAPWRFSPGVLAGMLAESAAFAVGLLCMARAQAAVVGSFSQDLNWHAAVVGERFEFSGRLVAFVGAGIYEEVLFRLLLLSALASMAVACGMRRRSGLIIAIVLSSLIFSGAHYIGVHGEAWQWYTFAFRFLAGGFFALLFVSRGFGITAGAHAGYDLLVGLL
jgi:membrane protease YdiL (CAAX protease family)